MMEFPLNTDFGNGLTRYMDKVYTPTQVKKTTVKFSDALNHTGQNVELFLDLYQPDPLIDPEMHSPLVILIHGGGFRNGTKSESQMVARHKFFSYRGYKVASIDYRLSLAERDPEADKLASYVVVSDAQAAIRYFRSVASTYRIDPNRIAVYGVSSGGIVSLMMGISSELSGLIQGYYPFMEQPENMSHIEQPAWVTACISEAGLIWNDYRADNLGSVMAGSFFDFHGDNDLIVPFDEAKYTIDDIQIIGSAATGKKYYTLEQTNQVKHLGFPIAEVETMSVENLWNNLIIGEYPTVNMGVTQIAW